MIYYDILKRRGIEYGGARAMLGEEKAPSYRQEYAPG
jgi:hypothetical protein